MDRPAGPERTTPVDSELSARMSRYPRRDTSPERALRSALHAMGLRYRLQVKVPGNNRRTIDIAFPGHHVAVFVDGCFWHHCPDHGNYPKSNADWWHHKLDTNVERDRDTDRILGDAGWRVVRIWEHCPVEDAVTQVLEAVRPDRIHKDP